MIQTFGSKRMISQTSSTCIYQHVKDLLLDVDPCAHAKHICEDYYAIYAGKTQCIIEAHQNTIDVNKDE